jgi:hypothetical protein
MNRRTKFAALCALGLCGWVVGSITSKASVNRTGFTCPQTSCNASPACSNNGVNCFPNMPVGYNKTKKGGSEMQFIGNTTNCTGLDINMMACTCSYASCGEQ